MVPAPQRLAHNEKYAAIEHQGHRGGGFLKRAEKSSAKWANKARWLMNSWNSLKKPFRQWQIKVSTAALRGITFPVLFSDKPHRWYEPAAHGRLQSSLRRPWGQRYSNRRPGQMLVWVLIGPDVQTTVAPLIQAGRTGGYLSLYPLCCWKESFRKFDMTYCHLTPADNGICFLGTYILFAITRLKTPASILSVRHKCSSKIHLQTVFVLSLFFLEEALSPTSWLSEFRWLPEAFVQQPI